MHKLILLLMFVGPFTACSWMDSLFKNETADPNFSIVEQSAKAYSDRKLEEYFDLFDPNINVFSTNGLGTARIASGMKEFQGFTKSTHRAKFVKMEFGEHFSHEEWLFVKQKMFIDKAIIEAVVGYKFNQNKITDMMIIGEKRMN